MSKKQSKTTSTKHTTTYVKVNKSKRESYYNSTIDNIIPKLTQRTVYNYHKTNYNSPHTRYFSMGIQKGNFYFDNPLILYNFITKPHKVTQRAKRFCFIDCRTPYYRLSWDFDMSPKDAKYLSDNNISTTTFLNYIIDNVVKALKYYIAPSETNSDLFNYIYSDRTDDKPSKLHLYFPNIIIDNPIGLTIRQKVLTLIREDNIYNDMSLETIIDPCVFKANGLRLLFQRKPKQEGYYKINIPLSTYPNIPTDHIKQLQLTSLKTTATNINFEKNVIDDVVLLDQDNQPTYKPPTRSPNQPRLKTTTYRNTTLLQTDHDIKFIKALVKNLSLTRVSDYIPWRNLMFLLGNYGFTKLAHKASKRYTNYDKTSVTTIVSNGLNESVETPFTIKSLITWSAHDNYRKHLKIIKKHKPCLNVDLKDYSNPKPLTSEFSTLYLTKLIENIKWNTVPCTECKSFENTNKKCKNGKFHNNINYTKFIKWCYNYNKIKWCFTNYRPKDFTKYNVLEILTQAKYVPNNITQISLHLWSKKSNQKQHTKLTKQFNGSLTKYNSSTTKSFGHFRKVFKPIKYDFSKIKNYIKIDTGFPNNIDIDKYDTFLIDFVDKYNLTNVDTIISKISEHKKECLYDEIKNNQTLILTPKSLMDFYNNITESKPYITVIDELESLFFHVVCDDTTNNKRMQLFKKLIWIIKNTKYLILVDTNLSKFMIEFIIKLRGNDNFQVINNMTKSHDRKYYILKNEQKWIKQLYADIEANKKLYICCDSKMKSEQYYEILTNKYKNLNILLHNNSTDILRNVNNSLLKYDVIITVFFDADFLVLNHLSKIFCHVQETFLSRSIFQKIKQMCNPSDKEIMICHPTLPNYKNNCLTNTSKLQKIITKAKCDPSYKNCVKFLKNKIDFNIDDNFTNLFLYFIKTRNLSLDNYQNKLIKYTSGENESVFLPICKHTRNLSSNKKIFYRSPDDMNYFNKQMQLSSTSTILNKNETYTGVYFVKLPYLTNTYKVGCSKDLKNRLMSHEHNALFLSNFSPVTKFVIQCHKLTTSGDIFMIENIIHKILKHERIEKNREIFKIYDIGNTIKNINSVLLDIGLSFTIHKVIDGSSNIKYIKAIGGENEQNTYIIKDKYNKYYENTENILSNKTIVKTLVKLSKTNICSDKLQIKINNGNLTEQDRKKRICVKIKQEFNLNELNRLFLKDLGQLSNINNFKHSQIYFMSNKKLNEYEAENIETENEKRLFDIKKRQMIIVKDLGKMLFGKNNILHDKTVTFMGGQNKVKKQKIFVDNYADEINNIFYKGCLKKKVFFKNSMNYFRLYQDLIKIFFGDFIKVVITKVKKKRYKTKNKRVYVVNIDIIKYIELMLNIDNSFCTKKVETCIKETHGKNRTKYFKLHGKRRIKNFFNK